MVFTTVVLAACSGGANDAPARDDADSTISPRAAGGGSGAPVPAAPGTAVGDTVPGAARPVALLIGTSLTAGYGLDDPARQAYPAELQRKADSAGVQVEIVNAGLSGETSAGAVRRAGWVLDRYAARAKVVLLETGANDGLRGLDPDSTRANLVQLVREVKRRAPAARVLLVQMEAPPNLGARYTQRFHDMFPEVARAEGATLLPFLLDGVAGVGALNQGDGIHPTAAGARRVAANLWPGVQASLR